MAADGYLPPLVTELKADVSGLRKGIEEAKGLVKKYKEDVDGLGEGFRQTKKESDGAGQAVSNFERLVRQKMRSGENSVSTMRTEWERLHRVIKDTRASLAKGGGDSAKDHDTLAAALKDVAALGAIASQFGVQLADATGKGLANGAAAGGPFVQTAIATAIIGAVALFAPVIGGAIATAVTFGLGIGVLGLGAMILKERPKIQKAWETLTTTSSGVFKRSALSLEKPFLEAISHISREFLKWEPMLAGIFGASSPLVMPLTEGITGFITNLLPGILDGIANAAPAFESFKTGFPLVGAALGEFFRIITENKEDIKLFTDDSMNAIARTILAIAYLIQFLLSAYGWIRRTTDSVINAVNSIRKTISEWWTSTKEWAKELFKGLGESIMNGIISGVKWKAESMKNSIVGAVKDAWGAVSGFLQTGSPSRLYMQLGAWTAEGYARGVDASTDKAWASLKRMAMPGAPSAATAAAAVPSRHSGGRPAEMVGVAYIYLDGREIQQAGIKFAQRNKVRNTSTGWS